MLSSNQRSSLESLLTPDTKHGKLNRRRVSIFPSDVNMISYLPTTATAQHLDIRTGNNRRGSVFGPDDNLLLTDQGSDILSISSYTVRTRNSSRGSCCTLEESARGLLGDPV